MDNFLFADFSAARCLPLAGFFAAACLTNGVAAWAFRGRRLFAALTLAAAVAFGLMAVASALGRPPELPESIQRTLDTAATPTSLWLTTFALSLALWFGRRWFVRPPLAWAILNLSLLVLGLSLAEPHFSALVLAPDNVPVVGLVFLLALSLWWAASQAVANDARLARGEPPQESQLRATKVLVWPDLIYTELIAMILVSTVLILWSLMIRAPLEGPADPSSTPNPAKAPWYFVGLQEMLIHSEAWLVGVLAPLAAVVSLMALPYLDRNPKGSGYYSFRQRRWIIPAFLLGFAMLWITPILIGVFLRGPNWDAYGPFEDRQPHIKAKDTQRVPEANGATSLQ